ncbi:MAG: hypothetical protein QM530_09820 [Phycisphaerales bacterium]|nr:hypothetical protein [Phycisphaerales bacterium]
MNKVIFTILVFCIIFKTGFCQNKNPDSLYYKTTKQTNYSYKESHPKETAQMYYNISRTYRLLTTDVTSYFQFAVTGDDSAYIVESGRLWILNSAEKVDDVFEAIREMNIEAYRELRLSNLPSNTLSAYKILKEEEDSLIKRAKLNLDWNWRLKLHSLVGANIGFRMIPRNDFVNHDSFIHSMIFVDSSHLDELVTKIKKWGFPKMSTVGSNAAMIQPIIKHVISLYFCHEKEFCQGHKEKLRFLVEEMHTAALQGEMEVGFYNYMISLLMQYAKKEGAMEDYQYFQKLEIKWY